MKGSNGRAVYLDALRILAAFFVIFNHLPGYELYSTTHGFPQAVCLFLTMITRMNTPLFMMISGALLIDKEEGYRTLFQKRILRIVIVIIIANILGWALYESSYYKELFFKIFKGDILPPYWYLYSYLGMLLCLPFIRKMARALSRNDYIYMTVIHFIFVSLLPCVNFVMLRCIGRKIELSSSFCIAIMIEKSIFYPVVGYGLSKVEIEKINGKVIVPMVAATAAGIVIESIFTVLQGRTSGYTQNYVMLFDYMIAMTVFVLVRKLFSVITLNGHAAGILKSLGEVTFGIYIFDPLLQKILYNRMEALLAPVMPMLFISLIWCLVSFIICGSVTYLLRKWKPVRRIL